MSENESPQRNRYNAGGLTSFIPLQEETSPLIRRTALPANLFLGRSSRVYSLSDDDMPDLALTMSHEYVGRRPTLKHAATVFDGRSDHYDLNEERRISHAAEVLMTPQMRSMRLIGNSNPRYRWAQYYKTPEQLKEYSKPLRKYYERVNFLIAHYLYIDRLLDSSLIHQLMSEYQEPLHTIQEEPGTPHENGTVESSRRPSGDATPDSEMNKATTKLNTTNGDSASNVTPEYSRWGS